MATWTPINTAQAPLSAGGFQHGAFQPNYEQDIFQLAAWVVVNKSQISVWSAVNDTQTALSAGGFQTGTFQPSFEQDIFQLPTWTVVNTAQP